LTSELKTFHLSCSQKHISTNKLLLWSFLFANDLHTVASFYCPDDCFPRSCIEITKENELTFSQNYRKAAAITE
jgi:hypothetical protein